MSNPYRQQAEKAFWRKAVQLEHPMDITGWYKKKWNIAGYSVATAGSCFAQHISRHLRKNGYNWLDMEPAPKFLTPDQKADYNYGIYSARYGNVYTSRQLLQLLQQSLGDFQPQETFWRKGDGVVDPFRPLIEPEPYSSVAELMSSRKLHLEAVRHMFETAGVFVFTLGLTESWVSNLDGATFPLCPGTAGGTFDPSLHRFHNLSYDDVRSDLVDFIKLVRKVNPKIRTLLTVSPVPLMATATDHHVVVATSLSKSVLRAAAGYAESKFRSVDYFPSYEIISSHVMRSQFYNSDMRTVADYGVDHVMKQFFSQHTVRKANAVVAVKQESSDISCDEEILDRAGAYTG